MISTNPLNEGSMAPIRSSHLPGVVGTDATRWKAALELAAVEHETYIRAVCSWFKPLYYAAARERNYCRWVRVAPESIDHEIDITDGNGNVYVVYAPRPADWIDTVAGFLAAGLTHAEIEHCLAISMDADVEPLDRWRYFCGCCWRIARQRHNTAALLIQDGRV